jgi:ABC-type amino acid transport system permease subunit
MSVLEIIQKYHAGILAGLGVTLRLAITVWFFGLLLGGLLGVASNRWNIGVGLPARIGSFFLSGIPVLVLLFWLHYPVQSLLNVVIDPFYTSVVTLTLINTFAVADLVRGTLSDFPKEYVTAARICGVPPHATLYEVQLPIITRQILPGLLLLQVSMLQATLFASLISVDEIFRVAQRINAQIYQPVQVYTALAVFFLIICLPLNGLALWLRAKYTRDLSER